MVELRQLAIYVKCQGDLVGKNFSVLIVGGGTAGWMAANLLAHRWRDFPVNISLVESTEIGTIGVGEGSTPYLKSLFRALDIPESEWMPACDATYKCGIRFPGWSTTPGYAAYYHPFYSPLDRETGAEFFSQADMRRRGILVDAQPDHFFHAPYLSTAGMAPIPKRPLPFELDYAYHFDAGLLGRFLKSKAMQAGVRYRQATIDQVRLRERGQGDVVIDSLTTASGEAIAADFFIDCTGFRSSLLSALPEYQFSSYEKTLLNNAAVALQMPGDSQVPLKSETVSEALTHGWMWNIPLQSRTGFGYVYGDAFISPEAAEQELRKRTGAPDGISCRHLKMQVGRIEQHWSSNCLGVGLSQGFIEPLEATALMLVQFTIERFSLAFDPVNPHASGENHRSAFNHNINTMFDGVLDYVVAHYFLNTRNDTEYWRAARHDIAVPERLQRLVDCWDRGDDFVEYLKQVGADKIYSHASWYCLLAGMGRFPKGGAVGGGLESQQLLRDVQSFCGGNVARFESHRRYLERLAAN